LSFLQDHHFRIYLSNFFCATYTQDNGIQQVSVLIVNLFSIAISGIVNTAGPAAWTSLYVDNIAICYSTQGMVTIECQLQHAINHPSH
jgi:hypothetical protein